MLSNRQVDLILQNSTQELLTIESFMTVQGEWVPSFTPRLGAIVPKQGSAKWCSVSSVGEYAVAGFMRFGCTKGYIDIEWSLPINAALFKLTVMPPLPLMTTREVTGPTGDYRVAVVTLLVRPRLLPIRGGA